MKNGMQHEVVFGKLKAAGVCMKAN